MSKQYPKKSRKKILLTKETLDRAYEHFHREFYRDKDPVGLVHAFTRPRDQEIVGLIAALLSYGNVTSIRKSISKVLLSLGDSPAERIADGYWPDDLNSFYHRFTRGEDFRLLFHWMGKVLREHGSLEAGFCASSPENAPMKERISAFVRTWETMDLPTELAQIRKTRRRNLKYLLSDPEGGAACKRVNMYLRWMVRPNDGIDLGVWTQVSSKDLILPIDTHLLQTLQKIGWTRSKNANWKVAEAATERLRTFCPEDPVRYDFSLCHLSMHGQDIASF